MAAGSSAFDIDALESMRTHQPAWRLLRADHAPFIISFLHRTFIAEQRRQLNESDVLHRLEDHLFALRSRVGEGTYPRSASDYLNQWASDACGWLRKSFVPGSDEPVCDLTPAAEQAIEWLASLRNRSFIGTESRLLTVMELLRQISTGAESDPAERIKELERRRATLDAEIADAKRGVLPVLTPVEIRDRFQLLANTSRALLSDLREVQQNFLQLDRDARSRIAAWDGAKGMLLGEIFGHSDAIAESDQGQSFRAFWDFLMSPERQEEFDHRLQAVLALPAVQQTGYDPRLRRIRFDWLGAGEQAQRTVARLSEQLRRFLDDRAWQESRRITQLIQEIERTAVAIRDDPPTGDIMYVEALAPEIVMPLERPFFTPSDAVALADASVDLGVSDADAEILFQQHHIDPETLAAHIRHCLGNHDQVLLPEVLAQHPLEKGLAELVGYLRLATDPDGLVRASIDEATSDVVAWTDAQDIQRRATLPRITFTR